MKRAAAEDLTCAHVKHIPEQPPRNLRGHHGAIEKALVVRREDEWAMLRQLFFAGDGETEKDAHDHTREFSKYKPHECEEPAAVQRRQYLGIVRLNGQHGVPAGSGSARSGWCAASRLQYRIDKLADCVNLGDYLFIQLSVHFALQSYYQLYSLHGIKAQVELKV